MKRQALHIKRKRLLDSRHRAERFGRKKEEARDPRLREQRLKRNVPLTLDRKRVWDEVDQDDDVEDGLGLSIDVDRIKRQKKKEEDEEEAEISDENAPRPVIGGLQEERGMDGGDDGDDNDSMLEDDGMDEREDDSGDEEGKKKTPLPSETQIRRATQRATSPNQSTTSTNLHLAPEALAARFPTLFSTDPPPEPKILITTSINAPLHDEANILTSLFPNSHYVRRTSHHRGHKFSVREMSHFASNRHYTTLIILEAGGQTKKTDPPTGLTIAHLPHGPTFHFTISNWIEGKKMPGHGNPTSHIPELILNNFRTPLGLLTAHLFRALFPPQPELRGRQVVTLHNQRDYIFVRRHRYIFRDKRETEKSVVGVDGKPVGGGVEGIRAGLQELGPRFTLKLRRVDKGIQRSSGQEWEWKGKMEKCRTKFQL